MVAVTPNLNRKKQIEPENLDVTALLLLPAVTLNLNQRMQIYFLVRIPLAKIYFA